MSRFLQYNMSGAIQTNFYELRWWGWELQKIYNRVFYVALAEKFELSRIIVKYLKFHTNQILNNYYLCS